MDMNEIMESLSQHIPEIILIVGGILAILIAIYYVKSKESMKYKALVLLGTIFGVLMIFTCVTSYSNWALGTAVIIAISGFALVIRPVREVHFSIILALLIMVVVYVFLGGLTTLGDIDISFLATGWPRLIVSFVVGGIVYMLANFAEAIIKLFGKILNCWPLLFVLGLICISEGICVLMGYGSLKDILFP